MFDTSTVMPTTSPTGNKGHAITVADQNDDVLAEWKYSIGYRTIVVLSAFSAKRIILVC